MSYLMRFNWRFRRELGYNSPVLFWGGKYLSTRRQHEKRKR